MAKDAAFGRPADLGAPARVLTWVAERDGERLDRNVTAGVPELSRSQAQKLIVAGEVLVNGRSAKSSQVLRAGDEVRVAVPARDSTAIVAEDIDVTVVYESADIVVVDKPAGMLVHPATGQLRGTLVNAMLYRYPEMIDVGPVGRQGVVHRLDKDTSGLVIFGRTLSGLRSVQEQFRHHEVWKTYLALVVGFVDPPKGLIDAPVGRHPRERRRQAVVRQGGRPARTQYETLAVYRGYTLVKAHPLTGRTHQIRVHFAALSHPVAGDPLYGHGAADLGLQRQFLHAHQVRFRDPSREEPVELESPLPADLQAGLATLAEQGRCMLAVGVCRLQMHIEASVSLKDKRQIVRSVTNRMRQRFNVAVAEIEDLDNWNLATIGIVCVSNEGSHAQGMLNKAVDWLENERLDVEIGDYSIEVW